MAYPVFLLLLSVSSAGVPVAISIIVSGYTARSDYGSVRRVFRISLRMMAGVGLALALLLAMTAGWLVEAGALRDGRAYYALIALTPSVFFASILASFRGFFQGCQLMTPPAVSQILEQFVRVTTMVVLAYVLLPYGLEYAAAGAAFGALPGSLTGLLVLGYFYRRHRGLWQDALPATDCAARESVGSILRRLLLLALPVSCANILVPVTSSIDALLVPRCLAASGFTVEQSTAMFGYLAGMAQPLILMATIPTMSLATSLVPAVSEAFTLRQRGVIAQKAVTAMKLCCLITVPAAVGMSVLAEPISRLLYGTPRAAVAVMHSGPAIWLLGMQQVTTGLLQGMGHSGLPMLNMLLGIGAKLIAVCQLTNAEYNIAGAAWATNINFGLTAVLNILMLRYYQISFGWYNIIKIILAAACMGAFASWCYGLLLPVVGSGASAAGSMLAAALFYAALLLLARVITADELKRLPPLKKRFK